MEVIYEDNHIIIVNKQSGEIVQGDKTGDRPLSDIVKDYIKVKYQKPGEVFLGVVHRLDRPVSGLVVFARTSKALTRLNKMFAESNGLRYVMMANHGGDHTIYPDCRPEFVDAFDQAASAGTFVNVRLRSPYTHITKADIARRGKALGIDYSETWSCYKGGEHHCGRCGTCVERREAFAAAAIDDKTIYDE